MRWKEMVWAQIHGYAHLHLDQGVMLPDMAGRPLIDMAGLLFGKAGQ